MTVLSARQRERREARNRLTASALSDDTDRLALGHVKRYAVDRLYRPDVREEKGMKVVYLEDVILGVHLCEKFFLRYILPLVSLLELICYFSVFL